MAAGALSEMCGRPTVWLRPGHLGYIGPEVGVDLHSVAVPVLSVGLGGRFVLDGGAFGQIRTGSSFAPARSPHRVNALHEWILLLFVDPAGVSAIADEMTTTAGPFGLGHRREPELVELCRRPDVDPDRIFDLATGGAAPLTDPRIRAVVAAIRRDPGRVFRAERIARRLDLSTSHFLRLFAHQSGTTFRGYQRWARVTHALRAFAGGRDLTRCAVDAGFATPSHLSETFHGMFGTSITRAVSAGPRFDLGCSP